MLPINYKYLKNALFYGSIAIGLSLVLDQWIFFYLNLSQPFFNASMTLKISITLLVILLFYDLKTTLWMMAGILIFIAFVGLFSFDTFILWYEAILEIVHQYQYSLYWVLYETGMESFLPKLTLHFIGVLTLIVFLLVTFLLSSGYLSILILAFPLFFINNLNEFNPWLLYLLLGLLLSVFLEFKRYLGSIRTALTNYPVMLMIAFSLIALTWGLSQIIDKEVFFSQRLNDWFNQDQVITGMFYDPYSLHHSGYYGADRRIGGPVSISHQPVMTISIDPTIPSFYLKGPIYHEFESNRWRYGPRTPMSFFKNYEDDQSFRPDFFEDTQAYVYDYTPQRINDSIYFTVTPQIKDMRMIFHPGAPYSLLYPLDVNSNWSDLEANFNPDGELYALEPINKSFNIASMRSAESSVLREISNYQLRQNPDLRQTRYKYLLEEYDATLAYLVYDSQEALSLRIQQIITHFRSNYTYSLEVSSIPFGQDFIETFLKDKEGYCVYYASFLTLLLQDMGVIARYVEGYMVPQANSVVSSTINPSFRQITHSSAHAWSEVYVEGYGWIILDATPASHIEYLQNYQGFEPVTPNEPNTPNETPNTPNETEVERPTQPIETPSRPAETSTPLPNETDTSSFQQLKTFSSVSLLTAIILVLFERYRSYKRRLDTDYLNSQTKYPPADLIRKLWKDMLTMAQYDMDLSQRRLTVSQIFDKMIQYYGISDKSLIKQSHNTLVDFLFNDPQQNPKSIEEFILFYRYLQNRHQRQSPVLLYNLRRFLLGPHI